jgi:hypothetical protein
LVPIVYVVDRGGLYRWNLPAARPEEDAVLGNWQLFKDFNASPGLGLSEMPDEDEGDRQNGENGCEWLQLRQVMLQKRKAQCWKQRGVVVTAPDVVKQQARLDN